MPTHSIHWRALALALLLLAGVTACGNEAAAAPRPTPAATRVPPKALPTARPRSTPAATRVAPKALPTVTPRSKPAAEPALPAAGPVTIVLTEQQLDGMLTDALAGQAGLPISAAAVRLDPGVIVGSGRVKMAFLNAELEVFVSLTADEGKLEPALVKVLLDGKPAPAFVQQQIMGQAAPYLAQAANADPGFYVEAVTITGDELQITGRR